jgi:peptide/nickel transport system ATP-binding protein
VTEGQILSEIMELEKKLNLSRIMITHDISVVASTCKRIAVMYAGCMMEVGNVVDVLVNPKHPYTQALKRSFPNFIGEKTGLHGIPGTLPDLTIEAQGCVFAPRCNRATEICQVQRPHSTQIGNNWQVYCHHAGE